jgi:FkbM family methyltransferase
MRSLYRRLERALNRRGYRITWAPPSAVKHPHGELSFDLEFVIAHLMLHQPAPFFLQIGANDGISNDPLYKFVTRFGWEGILLEPLPEVFEQLKVTYKDYEKLQLINAAISEQDGTRPIYTVRMEGASFDRAHQFSSFRKDVLLTQTKWLPDMAHRIEEREVQCVTFDTLLDKAMGRQVDLLQIDAEGYDLAILKMINFSRMHPAIVCYEHANLSKAQQDEAASLLFDRGYRLTRDSLDTIAYKPHESFGFR